MPQDVSEIRHPTGGDPHASRPWGVAGLLVLAAFATYRITGPASPTPHDQYVRLAASFLQGRLDLAESPPWLEIARYGGRTYVIPPPFPALLALPYVALLGTAANQAILSQVLGSVNAGVAYLLARRLVPDPGLQVLLPVMFAFGTIYWFAASVGSVWYLAHVVAVLLLNLAILETLGRRRPLLIGLALGAAYWTRLPVILSFPFFLMMTAPAWAPQGIRAWRAIRWDYLMRLAAGVALFVGLNFAYNWVRFGTALDVAYLHRPGLAAEPWFQQGLLHLSYVPRHLKVIFLALPRWLDHWPYLVPSLSGLAIWITTPAFAFALRAPWRHPLTLACWAAVAPVALVNAMHGTWGFAQFGYRFALDYYPFLFLLTALGMGERARWMHRLLVALGIAVNLWGVLATSIFSWATY